MATLVLPLAAYTGNSLGRKKTARQTGRGRKTCQEQFRSWGRGGGGSLRQIQRAIRCRSFRSPTSSTPPPSERRHRYPRVLVRHVMRDLRDDGCLCTCGIYPQLEFTASLLLAAEKPMCADILQRTNTENSKQLFPEKQLRSHSPNFHLHVSMSDILYINTIDLPILLQEICKPILGIYKSLTNTRMWNLGLRPRNSQKRNT